MANSKLAVLVAALFCLGLTTRCGGSDVTQGPGDGAGGGSSAGGTSNSGGSSSGGSQSGGSQSGGTGGASGGSGGSGFGGFGGGTSVVNCTTVDCDLDTEYCARTLPGVPGGELVEVCVAFPSECSAHDCTCFCTPNDPNQCITDDLCGCVNNDNGVTLVCATP